MRRVILIVLVCFILLSLTTNGFCQATVTSPTFTTAAANNTVTITLTGGTFKTGTIAAADFTFAGTDAVALGAGTSFVRTSDTVVTFTVATGLVGTNNTVLVKAATQAT